MPVREMIVRGLVQGVGFRMAVCRWARQLGINGFVRNRADGSVHIIAEGPEEKFALFESGVRSGCGSFAQIDDVEVVASTKEPPMKGFAIR